MTYTEAYNRLQEIVEKLENESVSVDELTVYLKEAGTLVRDCQAKLRAVKESVESEKLDGL